MRLSTPVQDEGDKAPYFPMVLLSVDRGEGYVFPPVTSDGEDAAEIANKFGTELLTTACPSSICAGDDRCFAILQDLCKKTGICLTREDHLETLDEAMQELFFGLDRDEDENDSEMPDPEELETLCEALMAMRDGELKQMPVDMVNMLLGLADWGFVPDKLVKRLRKLFR